jgi:hypothetical protein
LEKDLDTLAMLVSLWDEGGGSPWKPSYSDQKHQKQGNFPSFFSKVPFIYLFF